MANNIIVVAAGGLGGPDGPGLMSLPLLEVNSWDRSMKELTTTLSHAWSISAFPPKYTQTHQLFTAAETPLPGPLEGGGDGI